ncbi:crosslink repair DNA glycosylase YcaQ family protein [Gordonia sinesedis]
MASGQLTPDQARRIALAAQGFADSPPTGRATAAHLKRMVGRTRLIQMDSVNVAVRAHYLPLFSRIGPYDRAILDRAAWRPGRSGHLLAEYWAHEAALIPLADWPLFGWRMDDYRGGRYRQSREIMRRNADLAERILDTIATNGPATPRSIEEHLGIEPVARRSGGWWDRGDVKHVCEAMFAGGELAAVRDSHFRRHYDLTDRVIGPASAESVDTRDAHRALTERAAAALGVATAADLADYYRLKTSHVRPAIADLVATRTLEPVTVAGWRDDAYLHTGARVPRPTSSSLTGRGAILSPFDPLVFYRPRAERLFDFHYRIEIYVPEHKRIHGYYVHPYLLGTDLAARVDLKADRAAGVLRVPAAHLEPGRDATAVAASLATDLATMATWLGLSDVVIGERGSLATALRAVTR